MSVQGYTDLKDLLADIIEKHAPGGVMIEVMTAESAGGEDGHGDIAAPSPSSYQAEISENAHEEEAEEHSDSEQESEKPGGTDMSAASGDVVADLNAITEELRAVSQTHAGQAERLESIARALKAMGK